MNLYDEIGKKAFELGIVKPSISSEITQNLKYNFFEWQEEAIRNFLTYEEICEKKEKNGAKHLMFNMATGTGKTLLMASLLLYYYKKGYRNFIFFVNQNNIVSKTENNFLDKYHNKYLFNNKIIIGDKEVKIKKVDNFTSLSTNDIEIKFTTIQKLYNDINTERENNTTLNDLNSRNIVMLADEAHHLNAATKAGNRQIYVPEVLSENAKEDDIEIFGWEGTILNKILNKNKGLDKNKNVLLEFTATIPTDKFVKEKYEDKIIYKFDLKDFLQKGYTKEINLISSTFKKKERILHVLLMNWYRHFVAIRNGIPNFKPVILFRSKTIEESKQDFEYFIDIIENITLKDLEFLDDLERITDSNSIHEQGKTRTKQVLTALNGDYEEVIKFIKSNFNERNLIITNSKTNKTKKEKTNEDIERLLNNLEDVDNHIRAIFTVDRLTEGWDVLNLFDIVRLYEGQNAGGTTKKTPEATVKEKQLIGRGVRYFPFGYRDKERNKRKFEDDLDNEMRVLEELFFYTYDEESRYISHLKEELRADGLLPGEQKIRKEFKLKDCFKGNHFYENIKIVGNKLKKNTKTRKMKLEDLKTNFYHEHVIQGNALLEERKFLEEDKKARVQIEIAEKDNEIEIKISEFEKHIFNKALNIKINSESDIFNFKKLKKRLKIKSFDDLQKNEYLGEFKINMISPYFSFEKLNNKIKLDILSKFLTKIFAELEKGFSEEIGGDFSEYYEFEELFGMPKMKVIEERNIKISEEMNRKLSTEKWYILNHFVGTSEEVEAMKFISSTINELKDKYSEIFVLRNEEIYKIYDFETGKGFQPDFIMFLQKRDVGQYYQIFIEPKGEHLLEKDSWKEKFMEQITEKYGDKGIIRRENEQYFLIGLPFYNKKTENIFKNEYRDKIL
ncbi:MAG: DEAD/DEAH box helicase family protein [Fusobacteriaceae bacterium]